IEISSNKVPKLKGAIMESTVTSSGSNPAPSSRLNPVTGLDHTVMPKVTDLPKIPKSVLLVGNSFMYYNNGIVQWLEGMRDADGKDLPLFSMVTIAYGGIDWHDINSYFRPNGINSYTVLNDGSNTLVFNEPKEPLFDAVVLQDNSQGPIHAELKLMLAKAVRQNAQILRDKGVSPLLMLTWAFSGHPEMTKALADSTIRIANENDMMIVPVGLAFAKALQERPKLKLIIADKRHPSVAGTYLEVCVIYATLLKESPEGIKWDGLGELEVSDEDAAFLQKVAWDTVSSFFGWNKEPKVQ
ncbi:MAG: hypothetical protein LUC43_07730, partial [Burkholderiales bacterium]|nr:hypothetical protein [Burkholderiales bacterium]